MKIIRKKILFVLLFISLGFLFFPSPAYALWPAIIGIGIAAIGLGSLFGLVPGLGGIVGWIGTAFGNVIAAVVIGIFTGILTIPAILLQWSVDPWFIKYGYTTGGIIEIGWPVVRDLANMLIVLALVIIGLATALRLEEYQARKTLPILIGVALLINFTPVIMGVIVDFANNIMNFFLEGFLGAAIISNNYSNMMGALTTKNVFDVTFWIELVFMGIFAIVAGILFLLFALLFIMRRVAIWILVILSPIAFAAAILPATRGWFRTWWHQFIQWTFIGVFAAFFLWLGNHMIELASRPDFAASIEIGGDIQEMMNALAPFLVALVLLFIGFFVSLSTSAMSASGVIRIGQKVPGWIGAKGGQFAAGQTVGKFFAREQAARAKGEKTWMKRLEESKMGLEPGEALQRFREAKGLGKVTAGAGLAGQILAAPVLYPARWGIRTGISRGLEYGAKTMGPEEMEKRAKEYQEIAKVEPELLTSKSRALGPGDDLGRAAAVLAMARARGTKGLRQFTDEEVTKAIETMATSHPRKLEDIAKHLPGLIDDEAARKKREEAEARGDVAGIRKAEKDERIALLIQEAMVGKGAKKWDDDDVRELIESGVEPAQAIRKAAFKKAAIALKGEDIENLTKETLEHPEFQEAIDRYKPWNFIRRIGDEKGLDYLEKLQEKAEQIGIKIIARTNPSFLRAPYTPQGEIFLRHWTDEEGREVRDRRQVNEIIKEVTEELKVKKPEEKRMAEEIIKRMKEEEERRGFRAPRRPPPSEGPPPSPPEEGFISGRGP